MPELLAYIPFPVIEGHYKINDYNFFHGVCMALFHVNRNASDDAFLLEKITFERAYE